MKFLYAFIISLLTLAVANGQLSNASGDWSQSSTWSTGVVPGSVTSTDITITTNETVFIFDGHTVTTGNRNIVQQDNQILTLTVGAGGELIVEGNYGFSQNGTRSINVVGTPGNMAFLTIKGNLIGDGTVNIKVENAYLRIEGDLTADGDANVNVTVGENGIMYVKGDIDFDNNVSGSFDDEGTILVDGDVSMLGYNNTQMHGVFASLGSFETDIVLQPSDTVEFWGDHVDGNTVQQDNRTNPSFPAGDPAEGTYAEFAAKYPNLCFFSDYCKANFPFYNPLPVTWADVSVSEALGLVTVNWSTVSESANDYFEVYKSTDAENWISVGVVAGAGFSKELLSYSLTDAETVTEVTYYRVEQVDYDGASEFSKTVVYIPGAGLAGSQGLYPNPNTGSFYVDLAVEELLSVSITSSKGESIAFDYLVLDNLVKVEVDESAAAGFYTLTTVTNNGVVQKNFVIK